LEIISLIGAISSAIVSLILGLLSTISFSKKKKKEEELSKIYLDKFDESLQKIYEHDYEIIDIDESSKQINHEPAKPDSHKNWRLVLGQLAPTINSESEIESKVKERIDEIKIRIDEIEKRFPKGATLDKISSVNDAILATNIESLSESIKRIEEKLLTKWDVAKIFFQIIAGLGIIIGLIFGIMNYIKK
jgi:hypothetical protein